MATIAGADSPITVLVHMKMQPANIPRFAELCQELIADIEATEPAGNVKYHLFRNSSVENELTIIESYELLLLLYNR
jgi:quinol monooxygenase YgiN